MTQQEGEHRLTYQPALDGLRALAVLAVLAYHAGLSWAKGGFLGVDAFFVLSGYLITSLLLAERSASGRIDLPAFWARRARRLLPALFLMLAFVAAYAAVFAESGQIDKIRGDALATLGYVANWRQVFTGESYFDQFSLPSPLRHTWSLAIEEQWYLFWPLLVGAALWWGRGSRRALVALTVALTAGSAILMALLFDPGADPSRPYYGTDTRAQSLLVGAGLALLLTRLPAIEKPRQRQALELGAAGCAAFVGWLWVTTPDTGSFLYQGGLLASAVAVAVVIAAAVQPGGIAVTRCLSWSPLRAIGRVSYGVYLWHWPLYLTLTEDRTGLDGSALLAVRLAATFAAATLSYHLLELPVRQGMWRGARASWAVAPATAALLAVALVLTTRGGAPAIALPGDGADEARAADFSSETLRILVVGDSLASTVGAGLITVQDEFGIAVRDATIIACGIVHGDVGREEGWRPESEECVAQPEYWTAAIDEFDPDIVVLLGGFWESRDRRVDGEVFVFGSPEGEAYWREQFEDAITLLSSEGGSVVILTTPLFPPGHAASPPDWVVRTLNVFYGDLACSYSGRLTVLDLNGFLYPNGEYLPFINGINVRGDGFHFSPAGSGMVADWLIPKLLSLGQAARRGEFPEPSCSER